MEWSESVDTLLESKDGLDAFRTFLKSEFSEENIDFWMACEDFKKTKSSAKIVSKAQKIYSEFIQADAPREINIDFTTRDCITQNISEPTLKCFDDAQRQIYSLMAKDSFPRFLRSEVYKELAISIVIIQNDKDMDTTGILEKNYVQKTLFASHFMNW
ncbi:regulator of G-protein signaling 21 [Pelodiscus sinensis]|uniref:regulator of G-protein signaling 21 n=1 Tax=Pelodiscus sinensis TaxID=13735 RepID=UPI003F6C11EC